MHVDGWATLEKAFHARRQHVQTESINGRDADVPGDDILDLLQLALEGVVRLQDLFAVIVNHLAFLREPQVLLAALDQQ